MFYQMRIRLLGDVSFCLLCIFLFTAACGVTDQAEDDIGMVIGSSHITVDRVKRDLGYICAGMEMSARQRVQVKNQLLEQCINHYLVLEYAKEQKITITEEELQNVLKDIRKEYAEPAFEEALLRGYIDFEQWSDRLRGQLLVNKSIESVTARIPQPGYQEIKTYYEKNRNDFSSPKMIEFRQVVTRTREEAESLLLRLHNGEQMSEIAAKFSIAPEAEKGGNVGWTAEGQLNESMETALFSLPLNKLSPVVETPYGYHIFEVLSARPEGVKELSEVIDHIKAVLLLKEHKVFLKKWLLELRHHFEVKVDQDLISKLMSPEKGPQQTAEG